MGKLNDNLRIRDQASNAKDLATDEVIDVADLTIQQRIGKNTNKWLERNRSMVLRQTPVWAQSLVALMISLGGIAVIGGIFFRIDEVVTVKGQLKSIGGTVEVATPVGGRVAEVLFEDGENVEKGQLLIKYDTRDVQETKNTLIRLIELEKQSLQSQLDTLKSQKITLTSNEEVLKKRLKTKTLISDEMGKLVREGGFQKIQYLQQLDELFMLEKQVADLNQQKSRLDLQSKALILQSTKTLDQMQNQLKSSEIQLQYQNVKSPVAGIIFDPQASVESVLTAGQRIVSIVPQSGLYAEVYVPNQDIGYIKKGQEAKVRVDAFPFSRYGELESQVSQIAADALPPSSAIMNYYRYPVKLKLSTDYLESKDIKIPLKSGMSITTNLKLRDKPVISLLSDLMVDQTDSVKSIRQQ